MDKVLGIAEPPDGFTPEEKVLLQLAGEHTVESIYAKLPTSRMKAVVAMHFELGYNQEMLARIFNVTQEQIALEIRNIQKVLLGKPYRPHKPKNVIRVEDLLSLCLNLMKP